MDERSVGLRVVRGEWKPVPQSSPPRPAGFVANRKPLVVAKVYRPKGER